MIINMFSSESNNSYYFYIISFAIALCAVFIKIPQIKNILKAKKAESVSLRAVLLETCGHTLILMYHFAKKYPFTSYSEYAFLVPQDIILLCILLYYKNLFNMRVITGLMVYFFISIFLAFGIFPNFVLKIAIIYSLYQSKEVGQLSLSSWGATTFCSVARLLTSYYETGDLAVSANITSSIVLNIIIMVQIIYYEMVNRKEKLP